MPQISSSHADLFTTRVWTFQLTHLLDQHPGWIEKINRRFEQEGATVHQRSVRQGWKTAYDLFERDQGFTALRDAMRSCVKYAFEGWRARQLGNYRIAASVNMAFPGGYNRQHGHENVLAAGVYYLQVPENSGAISFIEPRPGAKYSPLEADNPFGSDNRNIQPKAGDMFVFPAWLEHSVETNDSDQARISLPFNVVASN